MLWGRLATGLYTLATADTGTGGLFNSTTPLIVGFYTNEARENTRYPYVVLSQVASTENDAFNTSPEAVEVSFQFGVYSDATLGQTAHSAIVTRLRTVFRRVSPTVSGYNCSQIIFDGSPVNQVADLTIYSVHEAHVLLSK